MFVKDTGFSFSFLLKSLLGFSAQLLSALSDDLGRACSSFGFEIVCVTFEISCS